MGEVSFKRSLIKHTCLWRDKLIIVLSYNALKEVTKYKNGTSFKILKRSFFKEEEKLLQHVTMGYNELQDVTNMD